MGLDFSKLDKLAYRDFDTPEAQRTKDELVEQGFSVVEDKDNPFIGQTGPERAQQQPREAQPMPAPPPQPKPSKKPVRPFQSVAGFDYRAFYGDVFRWHEKYNAIVIQNEEAWAEAIEAWDELGRKHGADNNIFAEELLVRVFEEMERNAKAAMEKEKGGNS